MKKSNKKAFSIIEILVGIFIFSLWITSVYAVISSTLRVNDYNANYIIASNLAREQLELVRNIRDSNYKMIKPYNLKNPDWTTYSNTDKFSTGSYYKIENNYSTFANASIIDVNELTTFVEWEWELWNMDDYRLCIDSQNRYTYDCSTPGNIQTRFYKYISIEEVKYSDSGTTEIIEDAFLLKSKVIWYIRWYHEFEVNSIIADWKRL